MEGGFSELRMSAVQKMAGYFHIAKSNLIEDGGVDCIDPATKQSRDLPSGAIPVVASGAIVPLVTLGRIRVREMPGEEEATREVEIPASVCGAHLRDFALQVEDDCVNRVVPKGVRPLADSGLEPDNGSIAVVETEALRPMLYSDNFGVYDDIVFGPDDGPVRAVGTVAWYQSAKEMG